MSYKFSKGYQIIGDLSGSDDAQRDTGIDFEDNYNFTSELKGDSFEVTPCMQFRKYRTPTSSILIDRNAALTISFMEDVWVRGREDFVFMRNKEV